MANTYMKTMFIVTNPQGNANENHSEIPPYTGQDGCGKKQKLSVDENVEKLEPLDNVG